MSGTDSGDSERKTEIDAEAEADGFHFDRELGYKGILLYFNEGETLRRTYNPETGEMIEESKMRCNVGGGRNFHKPHELYPFGRAGSNTWNGKGTKPEDLNR